jgi:hypothetical protein
MQEVVLGQLMALNTPPFELSDCTEEVVDQPHAPLA